MKANKRFGRFHMENPAHLHKAQSRNCQGLRKGSKRWGDLTAKSLKAKLKEEARNIIKEETQIDENLA